MKVRSAVASASLLAVVLLSGCGFRLPISTQPGCPAGETYNEALGICVADEETGQQPAEDPDAGGDSQSDPGTGTDPGSETDEGPGTDSQQPEADPACPDDHVFDELTGECVPADPAEPEPLVLSTDAVCSVTGDLEGAFSEAEILHYLDCVIPGVDGWLDVVYQRMPHPNAYVYVPVGVVGEDECGQYDDTSAHYCPASQNIYLGHERVWGFYSVLGDASLFMVVAHEVMHHIQSQLGVYDHLATLSADGQVTPAATILAENQADCGAGAYLRYLYDNGYLTGEEDLNDLSATLSAIADAERDGRDHGKLAERMDSFNLAFSSDLQFPLFACNQVIPEVPIITE